MAEFERATSLAPSIGRGLSSLNLRAFSTAIVSVCLDSDYDKLCHSGLQK
jgi:hypothetical protein